MVKQGKHEPTEQPEPIASLKASLDRALTDRAARDRISVELHIFGGLPEQAYRYDFSLLGAGEVSAAVDDAPGRKRATADARLGEQETRELLEVVRSSGVLDVHQDPPRFLPDTVVGRLEISDGETSQVIYFAADEAQAEAQGQLPRPVLRPVLDSIYRLGGRVLDMPSVKP